MADVIFDIGGGNNDYASLSAALAAQVVARPNLVGNDERLVLRMFSFNDTTSATVSATFSTDATRYVFITVPSAERHAGIFSTGKAYMSNTATTPLIISAQFTVVDGLQFTVSTANINGVQVNSDNVRVQGCILRATDINPQILLQIGNRCTIRNTLVYESGRHGIFINSDNVTLQNVTVANCVRNGIWNLGGTTGLSLTNVLSTGSGGAFLDFDNTGGGLTGAMTTCASGDTSADDYGGTGNRAGQTFTFVNAGAGDFHLDAADAGAKDFGTDLSGQFTDDIDGETRSGSWDIGADEHVAVGGGAIYPSRWVATP